jgi:hypothetical protein
MPIITDTFLPEEQTSYSHITFGRSYGMAAVFNKYELYKYDYTSQNTTERSELRKAK